jgi:hypothetical protein
MHSSSTSIQKISKKLGQLNQQVKHIYSIRSKVRDIYSKIENKKTKYQQLEHVIQAHQEHLQQMIDTHPEWKKDHIIAPIYTEASMEPTHIAHSSIASLMNTYYEISRREQELHTLNYEIQEETTEYSYALMDIEESQETILTMAKECESEAKYFGIPYNFQRCYQAIHDTSSSQFASI